MVSEYGLQQCKRRDKKKDEDANVGVVGEKGPGDVFDSKLELCESGRVLIENWPGNAFKFSVSLKGMRVREEAQRTRLMQAQTKRRTQTIT